MKEEKRFYFWQLEHIMAKYLKSITNATSVTKIIGIIINNSKILEKK